MSEPFVSLARYYELVQKFGGRSVTFDYALEAKKIQTWQRDTMGNRCTICHANNVWTACAACGWWGRVPPVAKQKVTQ